MWAGNPTFFIPGAPKAGTSTLYQHLRVHPDVCMSEPKEPSIFFGHFGDREYVEACFRHRAAERVFGDATATYMIQPDVPRRIHDAVPDARFIIALREPIARAVSQYEFRVQKGAEVRTFAEIVKRGLDEEILSFSAYGTHFSRFFALFPMDRFHFVESNDLARDPEAAMASVYEFLGVEPIPITEEVRNNVTRAPGSEGTRRILSYVRKTRVQRLLPRSMRPNMRRLASKVMALGSTGSRTELRPHERERLIELFEPEVEKLDAATGVSFPAWREAWARV
ncbi:MAG: sulfotransferase domain-containing protein [Actinomycetota bacterium]|nr:sulfotransferase domain-containing protein [Actinomycetota bacterium]